MVEAREEQGVDEWGFKRCENHKDVYKPEERAEKKGRNDDKSNLKGE